MQWREAIEIVLEFQFIEDGRLLRSSTDETRSHSVYHTTQPLTIAKTLCRKSGA